MEDLHQAVPNEIPRVFQNIPQRQNDDFGVVGQGVNMGMDQHLGDHGVSGIDDHDAEMARAIEASMAAGSMGGVGAD